MPDILPSSIAREIRGRQFIDGLWHIPIFCASCGVDGGWVPETGEEFACILCNSCADKHGGIPGTHSMPAEVFFAKIRDAQLEDYGRFLTEKELIIELGDPNSVISKLARERKG